MVLVSGHFGLALAFPGDRGKIPRRGDPRPAGPALLIRRVAGTLSRLNRRSRRTAEPLKGSEFPIRQVAGRAADRPAHPSDRRREPETVGHLQGWRRSYHETTVRRRRAGAGPRRVRPIPRG